MTATPDPGEPRLQVGRIGRAHGLRGEVAVTFISNRPERAAPGASVYVGDRELSITASRPHQGRMLVKFAGVDDRTAAEQLLGAVLTADPVGGGGWSRVARGRVLGPRAGGLHGRRSCGHVGGVRWWRSRPTRRTTSSCSDTGSLVPMVFVVEQRASLVVIDPPDGLFDL